jgi:hypothetical protein
MTSNASFIPAGLWTAIFGMAGLMIGFALNELSTLIKLRRDDRRVIGKALAELLEVRFMLLLRPTAINSLKASLPAVKFSAHDEFMIRKAFSFLVPDSEGLHKRYDEAVSAVSGILPLLAFELRSKDIMAPVLQRMRENLPITPELAPYFIAIEDMVLETAAPKLGELIEELAKLHGWKSSKKVKKILTTPFELPEEIKKNLAVQVMAAKAIEDAKARPAQGVP